jgi:Tfp pilus assembly protein PilF
MAEALSRRALEIFIKLDYKFGQAEVYKNYGKILRRRKEWDKAAKFFQESIELYEVCENPLGIAEAYHEFGLMCADKSDKDNAQSYMRKASQLFEQLGASKALEKVNQDLERL